MTKFENVILHLYFSQKPNFTVCKNLFRSIEPILSRLEKTGGGTRNGYDN